MRVTKNRGIEGCCEDCAYYQDCPMDYFCPAAEILKFFMEEQEAGRLKIMMRKDLKEEITEEEE